MKLRLFSSAVASLVMVLGASAADYSAETLSLMSVSDGSDTFCRVTGLDDPDASTVERVAHEGKYGNNIYPVTWGDRVYMTSCSQDASSENFFTITDNNLAMIAQASLGLDNPGHHVLPLTETSGYVSSFRHLYKYTVGDAGIELAPIAEGAFGHLAAIDGKLYVTYVESPAQSFTYAQMKTVKVFSLADDSEIKTIDCADKIDAGYAINKAVLALDGKIYLGILACDYSHYTDPCAKFMLSLDPATDTVTRIDFPDGVVGNASNIMNFNNATLIASTVNPVLYWIGSVPKGYSSTYHIFRYDLATGNTDIVVDGWDGQNQGCPVYKGSFIESPVTGILYHGAGDWGSAKLYSWNPADPETKTVYPQVKNIEGSIALFFNKMTAPQSITMSQAEATLNPDETIRLSAAPAGDFTVGGILWSSSNPGVASVAYDGTVTAHGHGEAVIYATSIIKPDVKGICKVSVNYPAVNYTPGRTVTVGQGGLLFYDDGGADGDHMPENFQESTMTFVPSTPSNKVQIEFKKFALYPDDIFKLYNGKEVDNDQLIERLKNEPTDGQLPVVITSSADDGSLTILWNSVTNDNTYRRKGFEAFVSEIAPESMAVASITMARNRVNSLAALETDKNAVLLNIKASGNAKAYTLNELSFDFGENSSYIKTVKVYAGKHNTDIKPWACLNSDYTDVVSPMNFVGQADVTGPLTTVNIRDNFRLINGDNYYHLVFDMSDACQDGTELQVKLASLKLSDNTVVPDTEVKYMIPVRNLVTMFRGEASYNIDGRDWTIRNLPKDENEGLLGYESDFRNWHTIKLYPATQGNKVEIDITKLNIAGDNPKTEKYFNGENQPQFYIYNGAADIVFANEYTGKLDYDKSKFGECLYAWNYDNNQKEVGQVYRSTADDGSLTIMFWHGLWGFYNGNIQTASEYGFTAIAKEVAPKTMEAVEAVMSRDEAWVSTVPTPTAVPVLDFIVKTDGALNASSLTSVTVDLKGNSTNIASLELFATGLDVKNTVGKSLGRVDVTEGKEDYTFAVSDGLLADGRNHYFFLADLRDDLVDHADLTVKMADVKVGESSLKLVNEDPEALVEARTWYYMQPGDNEILIGNNPVTFYDSNKIGGCYDLTSGTVTFAPRDPDAKIMVTVASRPELAAGDNLDMFSGKTTDKGAKVQTFKYNTKESLFPYSYTSEAADGSVTFEFVPTSEDAKYGKKTGWAIKVECYKNVSGIDEVEIDVNAPVDVYDIRGILVGQAATVADITATLPSGVYIVKQGTAVRKLLVK